MIKVQTNKKATKAHAVSLPLDEAPSPCRSPAPSTTGIRWCIPAESAPATRSTKVEVDLPAVIEFKYLRDGGVVQRRQRGDVDGDPLRTASST
ncbi:MAG: hypothetical protein R2710_30375 [Acidimicrobiales bacterium]